MNPPFATLLPQDAAIRRDARSNPLGSRREPHALPTKSALRAGAERTCLLALLCSLLAFTTSAQAPAALGGIGAVLLMDSAANKGPRVAEVLDDSPAEHCHLRPGAIISKVNGVSTAGKTLEECVNLIRGPVETLVWLEATDPDTGQLKTFMLLRVKLPIEN